MPLLHLRRDCCQFTDICGGSEQLRVEGLAKKRNWMVLLQKNSPHTGLYVFVSTTKGTKKSDSLKTGVVQKVSLRLRKAWSAVAVH